MYADTIWIEPKKLILKVLFNGFVEGGSEYWIRTSDQVINSHLLYR